MTIAQEAPMDAACRLAASALRNCFKFEALHTYTDREANPLYWRIRAKHPVTGQKWIRPMHLTGNGYELREPERPASGKPLYRLHELASRPDEVVILTEGEYNLAWARSWMVAGVQRRSRHCEPPPDSAPAGRCPARPVPRNAGALHGVTARRQRLDAPRPGA